MPTWGGCNLSSGFKEEARLCLWSALRGVPASEVMRVALRLELALGGAKGSVQERREVWTLAASRLPGDPGPFGKTGQVGEIGGEEEPESVGSVASFGDGRGKEGGGRDWGGLGWSVSGLVPSGVLPMRNRRHVEPRTGFVDVASLVANVAAINPDPAIHVSVPGPASGYPRVTVAGNHNVQWAEPTGLARATCGRRQSLRSGEWWPGVTTTSLWTTTFCGPFLPRASASGAMVDQRRQPTLTASTKFKCALKHLSTLLVELCP